MPFTPKPYNKIKGAMVATLKSVTPLTDFVPGSVADTLLEAPSVEDAQQYIQMTNLLALFHLDTIEGADLDVKAFEFGLTRNQPTKSSGYTTISDSAFPKISTIIYPVLSGPIVGSFLLNVVDASTFPTPDALHPTYTLVIGRGTANSEMVTYAVAPVNNVSYWTITLVAGFGNDHGTEETVVLSQGGNRAIPAGTQVAIPESDIYSEINYTSNNLATILDGEEEVSSVSVTAAQAGSSGNAPAGGISQFSTLPFTTALVTNPLPFNNGEDLESDQDFRDRIRNKVSSLAAGTIKAIISGIAGQIDNEDSKRVVSETFREAINYPSDISQLFIDDGTGFEPSFEGQGYEIIIDQASGGEGLLNTSFYPIVKASLVTSNSSPYNLIGNEVLSYSVNNVLEEVTFLVTDFSIIGQATALEVATAINTRATLIEARTTDEKNKVIITPNINSSESVIVNVLGAGVDANNLLGFVVNEEAHTLNLYKNDIFLVKDGRTAFLDSGNPQTYAIIIGDTLTIQIDGKALIQTITFTIGGALTAQQVCDDINDQLVGGVAQVGINSIGQSFVRLSSFTLLSSSSMIRVTGGTANALLAFPTTAPASGLTNLGLNKDYVMNRFNGQIRLTTPLHTNDMLSAGSSQTRAFVSNYFDFGDPLNHPITGDASDDVYAIADTQTLIVTVDGGAPQTHVFTVPGDFIDPVTGFTIAPPYDATQVAEAFNSYTTVLGARMDVVNFGGLHYLRLRSTDWENGTIYLDSASTANPLPNGLGLGLTDTTISGQTSSMAYIESGNSGDYSFGPGMTFSIVLDQDPLNRLFIVPLTRAGAVTTQINNLRFRDSSLVSLFTKDSDLIGYEARFTDTTVTVALSSQRRTVIAYDHTNGEITVGAAFGGIPIITDDYELIPVTTLNTVNFIKNKGITPLSVFSAIEESSSGSNVQITPTTIGSSGAVQVAGGYANGLSVPVSVDGDALGTIGIDSISGLSINLHITVHRPGPVTVSGYIDSIVTGADHYILTVTVAPDGAGGAVDLSTYTIAVGATISAHNLLDFPTNLVEGMDGYKNYTGLMRKCQWLSMAILLI